MAEIIDLFTRQPINTEPVRRVVVEHDSRQWFKEWAGRGPENLDEDQQAEWITLFHEYYLNTFFDAVEGAREATEIGDLEHFMRQVVTEVGKWPKS